MHMHAGVRYGFMELPREMPCEHEPQDGTLYTATGGLPASMKRRSDFPIDAMCAKCSRAIRRDHFEVAGLDGAWHLKYPPGD